MSKKVPIRLLETGVPGLDRILAGGVPEFSFNLIAGMPGAGKTTLAHQIMFSLANPRRRALYFTVLGEPPLKMLRYQQQFDFFDTDKVETSIRFINLAAELIKGDLKLVLKTIMSEVAADSPGLVFVDSFRSIVLASKSRSSANEYELQHFVQELGIALTSWEATTFLVGEHEESESHNNPIFTVADGLIWLSQDTYQGSMVRKLEVKKMRGVATLPGQHTFRISGNGLQIFPRAILEVPEHKGAPARSGRVERISMGVKHLDEMLGGGLPKGYSLLVAGPSGSGKTIMATEFLSEGARRGEKGVILAFEKSPGMGLSPTLDPLVRSGKVGIISTRALDLAIDSTLYDATEMIKRMKAKRVVIDSLSGLELALAPTYREDFRDSMYRMISVLTGLGVTVLVTSELEDRYVDLRFSSYGTAFLTDSIILERYVQLESEVRRCIAVVKVRNSDHSKQLREFMIVKGRLVIGDPIEGYEGLLVGRPTINRTNPPVRHGSAKGR